jgi:hypothetical protein
MRLWLPPPPTPPRKGEGRGADSAERRARKFSRVSGLLGRISFPLFCRLEMSEARCLGAACTPLPLAGRGRGWGLSPRQNRDEQSFACLDPAKGGTPAMTANKKGGREGRPFLISYRYQPITRRRLARDPPHQPWRPSSAWLRGLRRWSGRRPSSTAGSCRGRRSRAA